MHNGEWRNSILENNSEEREQINCETFQEALSKNLVGILDKKIKKENSQNEKNANEEFLSNYEKELLEREESPKINMLIDIDGVLIDTEAKIVEALKIFGKDMHLIRNSKEAFEASRKAKIPFESLRGVLKCKKHCINIVLVTDRFGVGPCYFPCFNKKGRKIFEEHGINVSTDNYKFFPPLADGKKFLPMIKEGDICYYIGSSGSDQKYVNKMRTEMKIEGIPEEKLKYIHVQENGRTNFL